ncbi:MAG: efflux RND transporter permease subunit, partial [Proteobacteria bacterium]|nr:efflux RND transporter permease subunit [Pseudomonadota bacterium]
MYKRQEYVRSSCESSLRRLGVDLFPSVEFPVVSVTVPYPGASPEVVESLVTRPVEDAVSGLADLDSVSSTSSEGVAVIIVTFKDKADPKTVAIDVEKRVNAIRGTLPNDILAPTILKFDFTAAPIMNIGLSGDNLSAAQAFRLADEVVRPKLEITNGVGQVSVFGGQQREVQVKVDASRLRAYGLSLAQVSQALGLENIDAPGGRIEDGNRNLNLRIDAKFRSIDEIGETVVSAPASGGTIRVRDLAKVEDTYKEQNFLARVDGRPGVGISVSKQSSSNVTATAASVRDTVAKVQAQLPEGVTLKIISDSSAFITDSLNGVQRTLLEANILTGIVLLAFLHSWRSTIIVLLAIPTSLIATFAFMYLQGFTFNFLTTLALTLTIGILVDDSIVVLENIFRFLQRGDSPRVAALRGRAEIGLAAIAITLVDVVVFAPVGLLSGQIGQFFRQFGFTVVFATLCSLAVSFTLTPLLASRWLRAEDEHGTGILAGFGRWFNRG